MFINDLFENDEMFAAKRPGKYYDRARQPREYQIFWDQLIAPSGKSETIEGELLRAASKIQHDFYNNGFGNNWSGALAYLQQYLPSFGVSLPYSLWNTISPYATGRMHPSNDKVENQIGLALDQLMDGVMAAIRSADGNYHPNQTDMYDMNSPTEWSDEEEEDDDTYDYDDEELDEAADALDSEMFAPGAPAGAQQQIYYFGLNLLRSLEAAGREALRIPELKQAIDQAGEDQDVDQLFGYVMQLADVPFKKAYVVDSFIREFTGQEGLNDFAWMLESGCYSDLYDAWEEFKKDKDVVRHPSFKSDVRDFFKTGVNENADEMFASHLDRILSKFNFPENGPLGFMIGGGGFDDSFGGYTDGLTIVDREKQQIAFIPDFTYFNEDPSQEELGELFYDDDPEYGTTRLPITAQMVKKVRSIQEAEVELDEPPAPERKQQTKTKPKFNYDPFQQQKDQPLASRPEPQQRKSAGTTAPKMRQASASDTRRATAGVQLPPEAMRHLNNLGNIEIDPNLADYPDEEPTMDISTQVNTENLPSVAGQALAAAGETSPAFHQVARLPGNMSRMIRQLGKVLFGSMTNTPTEEIYMIGNLGGQGPNTRMEVNAVANFVRENGDDMGPGDIDFAQVMPGYSAQTHQYSAAGIRWLLVKDFAGEYIYAWPESDSKNISNAAQLSNEPKRIG
jgi:hypothetical protein